MNKTPFKIKPKGKTFEEVYSITKRQMDVTARMEPNAENAEFVYFAQLIIALTNTQGNLPINIVNAAYYNNPDLDLSVPPEESYEPGRIIKNTYKRIGHIGTVKIIRAINKNNEDAMQYKEPEGVSQKEELIDLLKDSGAQVVTFSDLMKMMAQEENKSKK